VVSDDPDTGCIIRDVLAEGGFAVGLLSFPGLTRERVEVGHPDLIVLDVLLLVLSEWPALDELWRLATPPPIIAVSAPYSSPQSLAMLSHHVRGHLTKPFAPRALLEACRRLLSAPAPLLDEERRGEPRQVVIGEVVFMTSKGRPSFSGLLLDLSQGGARIDVGLLPEAAVAHGRLLRLALQLPPGPDRIELRAKVEWRKDSTIGVSYVDVDPQLQLWLTRWMSRFSKASEPS
jgi:DNA-binding response OmpR family regulator